MAIVERLKRELAEARRQRDMWENHWRELNAAEGQWKKRCEELQDENDKLREFIERDKRSHLANARADDAEALTRAVIAGVLEKPPAG